MRRYAVPRKLSGDSPVKYFLLVLALIAAVVAALMFVPVKNGRPLLSPDHVQTMVEDVTGQQVPGLDSRSDDGVDQNVWYRWQDSAGRWQYGQRPPPGVAAEEVEKKSIRTVPALGTDKGTDSN